MSIDPNSAELRVLGCLIEKQRTTPDQYPLSVNAIRVACNQSTNRDPVVDYDERTVDDALESLHRRRWVRLASGPGSRARKYRQLFDAELSLGPGEMAVLGVLMLRGPQTPGELKQRTERMHSFADLMALEAVLDQLIERGLVIRLERRPGQKEQRYRQAFGGDDLAEPAAAPEAPAPEVGAGAAAVPDAAPVPADTPMPGPAGDDDRLARLERELGELRDEVARLRIEMFGG